MMNTHQTNQTAAPFNKAGMRTENMTGNNMGGIPDPVADARMQQAEHKAAEGLHRKKEALLQQSEREHRKEEVKQEGQEKKLMKEQEHNFNAQNRHAVALDQHSALGNVRGAGHHAAELQKHQIQGQANAQELGMRNEIKQEERGMKHQAEAQKEEHKFMKEEERQAHGGSGVTGKIKDAAHKAKAAVTGKP